MSAIWSILKNVVSIAEKVEKQGEINDEHLGQETQDGYDFSYGVLGAKADYRSRNRSGRIVGIPHQAFFITLLILALGTYFLIKREQKKKKT